MGIGPTGATERAEKEPANAELGVARVVAAVVVTVALVTGAALMLTGSGPAAATRTHDSSVVAGPDAVYEYLAWGSPPDPVAVMKATGEREFTFAFVIAKAGRGDTGSCVPSWNGNWSLSDNAYSRAIAAVRRAGGDVAVSFGGATGPKLGTACASASALARAYDEVVDRYRLRSIDLDIEGAELASATDRARELGALALVERSHPGLYVSVTFPTDEDGPDASGAALLAEAARAHLRASAWTVMPFDFGRPVTDMASVSISAVRGLARDLARDDHESLAAAYRAAGISSMNGETDESDEVVTVREFALLVGFAQRHHLARLTFWALNRDRECASPAGLAAGDCSGIAQRRDAFTKLLAGFR